jgi:hypothetical protein
MGEILMRKVPHLLMAAAAVATVTVTTGDPARAALTLTAAGIADGFALSLFADTPGPASGCCGPLGIATNNLGQVVLQYYPTSSNFVFNDVDGQHLPGTALSSAPFVSTSYGVAITNDGGTLYAGNNDQGGQVFQLNPNGSSAGVVPNTSGKAGHGIATNPVTGHLEAASANGIFDINPANGASFLIKNVNADGVSVSADGKTVYAAIGGDVFGFDIASGNQVYDSGYIGSPDGTGVIQGTNQFSGDIVSNDNDGTVKLLDPVHNTVVTIASGGTRGDYVGLDLTNGSLFLTQSDSVYRLTCGQGCSFTPPPPPGVPEPATLTLIGTGLVAFGLIRRRRGDV